MKRSKEEVFVVDRRKVKRLEKRLKRNKGIDVKKLSFKVKRLANRLKRRDGLIKAGLACEASVRLF